MKQFVVVKNTDPLRLEKELNRAHDILGPSFSVVNFIYDGRGYVALIEYDT